MFWAVAHSATLTKAARELGVTQPSLSHQLARLEAMVGVQLFGRQAGRLGLTEAGRFLLRESELVLAQMRELESGLGQYGSEKRRLIRIAGVSSVLRGMLPLATIGLKRHFPELELDIHEVSPGEVLEAVYGHRVDLGLVGARAAGKVPAGYVAVPILEDPYVLAVPAGIDLAGISDPYRDLPNDQLNVLLSAIESTYDAQRGTQVQGWFRQMLPGSRLAAQCRSFEVALGMVQAGTGVCLAPASSAGTAGTPLEGVVLYRLRTPPLSIVALISAQQRSVEPYGTLVRELEKSGDACRLPPIEPPPAFLDRVVPAEI